MNVRGGALAALVCVSVTACAQRITQKEDLLVAAGFSSLPANTSERMASLRSLPPHRFISQVRNGKVAWIYADPTVCACLYIGNEQAYNRYKLEISQRHLADEQSQVADTNRQPASGQMQWDALGPWWSYYGY